MLNPIGFFNLAAILATLVSLFFLIKTWRYRFRRDIRYLLFGLLSLTLVYHYYLAMEWFGIDPALEVFEDIDGALVALWWGFVFYGFFNEVMDNERQKVQEALGKSEKFLNTIFENMPTMIFIKDAESLRFAGFNRAAEKLLGYSRDELLGKNDYDFFPKEQADFFTRKDREVLERGELEDIPAEVVRTRRLGTRILNTKKMVLFNDDGRAEYLLGISEDITEKVESARELERWGSIFNNAGWGVAVVGEDWRKLEIMNPAFAQMHDYCEDELKGYPIIQLIAPDSRERFHRETESVGREWQNTFESVHIKKNGAAFPVKIDLTYVTAQRESSGYGVINVQDITEAKIAEKNSEQLETRLRQAQKMESLGTLAGGIAHDFNNILGVIFGYTELALLDLNESDELYPNLKYIIKSANRAKDLVRQILTFSRQAEIDVRPVMVGAIVVEAVKFLRSSIPTFIDIRTKIPPDHQTVLADATQIHQVIINLGANAAHAMKEKGGVLEIKLDEYAPESDLPGAHLKAGRYLRLTVSDTGHGIDPKTLERIFEPYFTTKNKDEGTGLGLAVVHGIVNSHGGEINVYSEPGRGTTFRIYLPLIRNTENKEIADQTNFPTGTEKIMFIDDERALTDVGSRFLEYLGYTVEAFSDSTIALEKIRSDIDEYDLIITDQTMPGVTGADLAREVLKLRPGFPVILCTGFSRQVSAIKTQNTGIAGFLLKPLTLNKLAVTVRSVLDEKHGD